MHPRKKVLIHKFKIGQVVAVGRDAARRATVTSVHDEVDAAGEPYVMVHLEDALGRSTREEQYRLSPVKK